MISQEEIVKYNRSRIYEQLDYAPEPEWYDLPISWIVQQQIASTNGQHYKDRVGKLKEYPRYEMPVERVSGDKVMLDIGTGWGRWLLAGAERGYIPVGMDIRLEFCKTAINVLRDTGNPGYAVVGDLENIPFRDSVFDLIWSFSVIQHTHKDRMVNCLSHINRMLKEDGFTKLEFPNKKGIRNSLKYVAKNEQRRHDYNSWCVRYYTPDEYRDIISQYLRDFSYDIHSFIGIGVLKEDLRYVSLRNKAQCLTSLLTTEIASAIPPLKKYADSLYVTARKKPDTSFESSIKALKNFLQSHHNDPTNNLNIIHLLKCPISGGELKPDSAGERLHSPDAGMYFPVVDNVHIMIRSEAVAG